MIYSFIKAQFTIYKQIKSYSLVIRLHKVNNWFKNSAKQHTPPGNNK